MKFLIFFSIMVAHLSAHGRMMVDKYGRAYSKTQAKVAPDTSTLRKIRRVGVSFGLAGLSGSFGLGLDLNFTPKNGFQTGFGVGNDFQTFHMQYKHYVSGDSFSPYIGAGFARWYTTGEPKRNFNKTSPSFLAEKFLNNEEKQGKFAENFLFPSAGIQFMQLKGEWAGTAIYGELAMLIDIDDLVAAPTGGLGMSYYF